MPRTVNLLLTVLVLAVLFGLSLAQDAAQDAAEMPSPSATAEQTETTAAAEPMPEVATDTDTPPGPMLVAPANEADEPETTEATEESAFPFDPGSLNLEDHFSTETAAVPSPPVAPAAPVADAPKVPFHQTPTFTWLIFGILLIGSFYIGQALSKAWRLPDHSFRIFVLVFVTAGSIVSVSLGWHRLTLGIDLRGGVVLVYDVADPDAVQPHAPDDPDAPPVPGTVRIDMDQMARAIGKRINPAGVREIAISKLGDRQLQVIIPEAEDAEVARIRRIISESGALEFRILASTNYERDRSIIEQAQRETSSRVILNAGGERVAEWILVDPKEGRSIIGYHTDEGEYIPGYGDVIKRPRPDGGTEVLVLFNDGCDVTGQYLSWAGRGFDDKGQPGVSFHFNSDGERRFRRLTTANQPDEAQPNLRRYLGILMNDTLHSAPSINAVIGASGIISFGRRHGADEVRQLNRDIDELIAVLDAGSLPTALEKEPASQLLIGATLGDDTIRKANSALILAGIFVLGFMVVYYRLAGLIACFCVFTNLALIVAVMLMLRAAFTLPGLAGLVLTIGMAIDANILIYERLREELAGGASLKMAIRNAYAKAFSAIFDSNVTSIIVGIVLYTVGTEQVKGFAVTLILGLTFNLLTAVYCARTIMDCMEAQRSLKTFRMFQLFPRPNINFIGARWYCVTFSIILTVIGFAALGARGRGVLDIDFIGGVSVEALFKEAQSDEAIRVKLRDNLNDLSVQTVRVNLLEAEQGAKANTRFIITTSIPQGAEAVSSEQYLRQVRDEIKTAFGDALVYRQFDYSFEESPDALQTVVRLTVNPGMNHESLVSEIRAAVGNQIEDGVLTSGFTYTLTNEHYYDGNLQIYNDWTMTATAARDDVEKLLQPMKATIDGTPRFDTTTTIGGSVARHTQIAGVLAIIVSLVCIVLYMWLRFQKLVYGLAAAIGLIHIVFIALGMIAISKWLTGPLGFLQVEEFKIGLPVVAAFLTIIAYALNDAIILFDRIRENRGKSPKLTDKMINDGINQTLSRTVLTTGSTAVVTLILYFWGGQGIHTFAFTLSVGVIFGTYGTIGICAPMLLWMAGEVVDKKNDET